MKKNGIIQFLENMEEEELVLIWNEYCLTENGCCGDKIDFDFLVYPIDYFNEATRNLNAFTIVKMAQNGGFDAKNDCFFSVNFKNDQINGSEFARYLIDVESLANFIVVEKEDFGNEQIQAFLKSEAKA